MSVKNKEKVIKAIKKGKIDVANISFPNLIDPFLYEL